MSHTVFRVSGGNTNLTYYGYATSGKVRETFLAGCNRSDSAKRGDSRLLVANGDDVESLVFTLLDTFDEEYDAWVLRNTCRADDNYSITGPTVLPLDCNRRALNELPAKVAMWKIRAQQKDAPTAMAAYQLGAYTFDQIKQLSATWGKDAIKSQLFALTPAEFTNLHLV